MYNTESAPYKFPFVPNPRTFPLPRDCLLGARGKLGGKLGEPISKVLGLGQLIVKPSPHHAPAPDGCDELAGCRSPPYPRSMAGPWKEFFPRKQSRPSCLLPSDIIPIATGVWLCPVWGI